MGCQLVILDLEELLLEYIVTFIILYIILDLLIADVKP